MSVIKSKTLIGKAKRLIGEGEPVKPEDVENMHEEPVFLCLAAGQGSRLRPLTNYLKKEMYPFGDKPFLAYTLRNLKGLTDTVYIAVELDLENTSQSWQISDYFRSNYEGIHIHFIDVEGTSCIAETLKRAYRDPEGKEIICWLGDTYVPRETFKKIMECPSNALSVKKVDFIPQRPVVVSDSKVDFAWGVESNYASTGVFKFRTLLKYLHGDDQKILEIVQRAIMGGETFLAVNMDPWLHLGSYSGVNLAKDPQGFRDSVTKINDYFTHKICVAASVVSLDKETITIDSSKVAETYYELEHIDRTWPCVAAAFIFNTQEGDCVALVKRTEGGFNPDQWALIPAGGANYFTELYHPIFALAREAQEELKISWNDSILDPIKWSLRVTNQLVHITDKVSGKVCGQGRGELWDHNGQFFFMQVRRFYLPAERILLQDGETFKGKPLDRDVALVRLKDLHADYVKPVYYYRRGEFTTLELDRLDLHDPAPTLVWFRQWLTQNHREG